MPSLLAAMREHGDAERLADREAGDDADEQPERIAREARAAERDAGVREREHRHHDEGDPWVRAHGSSRSAGDTASRRACSM